MENFSEPSARWEDLRQKIIGFGEDSTRKSYYPELQQRMSELERFRSLLDQANDIIILIEIPSGCIIDVNNSASRLLNYSTEKLLNMSIKDILREEIFSNETLQVHHQKVLNATLLSSSGASIPVEMTVRTVIFDGKLYSVAVGRDITERIKAEEEKKKLEEHLKQAQKMEAIGTLAGGIAHDFNNILGAIIGYTQLALMDISGEPEIIYNLEQVLKASKRAKEVIKQILAFSRQSKIESKTIDLANVIEEVSRLIRASIPSTIEIKISILSEKNIIRADETQVHQVLMNLCTNGAYSMKGRGGILEISLADLEITPQNSFLYKGLPSGLYLNLSVIDTGTGIDPSLLDRIFEPYFTTRQKGEGTGMGLAVAHGILQSHGGEILVESEVGKGTSFHVLIPRDFSMTSVSQSKEKSSPVRGNERILFVDDEKDLVYIAKIRLGKLGYNVTTCTSSEEALELFRKNTDDFDIVITDHTMPRMTGLRLAEEINKIRPSVPIILCTGLLSETEKINAEIIREFMVKPFDIEALAKAIRRLAQPV